MSLMRGDNDKKVFCEWCKREIGVDCFTPSQCRARYNDNQQRNAVAMADAIKYLREAVDKDNRDKLGYDPIIRMLAAVANVADIPSEVWTEAHAHFAAGLTK